MAVNYATPPGVVYNEIIEDTPVVVTTTVAAKRLIGEGYPYKYVLSYLLRVRSMGTATYIGIGTEDGGYYRLTAAGQALSYGCNRYEVIDLTKKWIICDTADATVEVMCSFLPLKMYGQVRRAV